MKPEAMRIAIAEACGWKLQLQHQDNGWDNYLWFVHRPDGALIGQRNWIGLCKTLPDYLNDLNAMHEAEHELVDPSQRRAFVFALIEKCQADKEYLGANHDFLVVHATTEQRAEAFLKSIGKWTDDA